MFYLSFGEYLLKRRLMVLYEELLFHVGLTLEVLDISCRVATKTLLVFIPAKAKKRIAKIFKVPRPSLVRKML